MKVGVPEGRCPSRPATMIISELNYLHLQLAQRSITGQWLGGGGSGCGQHAAEGGGEEDEATAGDIGEADEDGE